MRLTGVWPVSGHTADRFGDSMDESQAKRKLRSIGSRRRTRPSRPPRSRVLRQAGQRKSCPAWWAHAASSERRCLLPPWNSSRFQILGAPLASRRLPSNLPEPFASSTRDPVERLSPTESRDGASRVRIRTRRWLRGILPRRGKPAFPFPLEMMKLVCAGDPILNLPRDAVDRIGPLLVFERCCV